MLCPQDGQAIPYLYSDPWGMRKCWNCASVLCNHWKRALPDWEILLRTLYCLNTQSIVRNAEGKVYSTSALPHDRIVRHLDKNNKLLNRTHKRYLHHSRHRTATFDVVIYDDPEQLLSIVPTPTPTIWHGVTSLTDYQCIVATAFQGLKHGNTSLLMFMHEICTTPSNVHTKPPCLQMNS